MSELTMAFGITEDDIENVLRQNLHEVTSGHIEEAYEMLDHDRVAKSALQEVEMEAQVAAAYEDIKQQLQELKLI